MLIPISFYLNSLFLYNRDIMRYLFRSLPFLLIQAILLLSLGACDSEKKPLPAPEEQIQPHTDTTAVIVLQVNRCARLYTTEYHIHKIVTYADDPSLKGHILGIPVNINTRIGDRKIAIPIDVTLKGYIDFADFDESHVERSDSSIVITLPDPKIVATATQVDHKGTRQFIGLTRSRFTDEEITNLTRQGSEHILSHISQYGIVEQARVSATRTLTPILQKMGYKEEQIVIRFGKTFNDQDLFKIVQLQSSLHLA